MKTFSDKKDGGLGFHDLEAFNDALLANQFLRILHYLTSLVSSVLKAKYFLNGSILDAGLDYRPSYT